MSVGRANRPPEWPPERDGKRPKLVEGLKTDDLTLHVQSSPDFYTWRLNADANRYSFALCADGARDLLQAIYGARQSGG